MELIIIISLVAVAWIVSGYAADGYAMRKYKVIVLDNEMLEHIRKVVDYSYDCEREHYMEAYGEESNNYLFLYDVPHNVWEIETHCSQTCWDYYFLGEQEVGGVSREDVSPNILETRSP